MPKAKYEEFLATEPIIPGPIEFDLKIPNVSPWSAESPKLYDLEIELLDPNGGLVEMSTLTLGFRRVEVMGNELLVNGLS